MVSLWEITSATFNAKALLVRFFWHVLVLLEPHMGILSRRFIFKPLKHLFNPAIATLLTFGISGLIHDLAVILIKSKINFFLRPGFLMGLMVIFNKTLKINYHKTTFWNRVLINAS